MPALFALLLLLSSSAHAAIGEGTGLKLNAAADLTGEFGAKNEAEHPHRVAPREGEINVYGPIDHGFDGVAAFAAHQEDGEYHLEIHELYLSSNKLLPNLRVRAGHFFLGLGRLNQFHRHDWPFFNAPKMQKEFFDEEAASDTGLEANYLFAFLPIYTELGLGVTNGWTFGHAHGEGEKPIRPTHYARLANFFPWESGGLATGLNYLNNATRTDGNRTLYGIDAVAKWSDAGVNTWLIQGELFGRTLRSYVSAETERDLAGYIYGQRHVTGGLFAGVRFDGYSVRSNPETNFDFSIVPTLTYKHSEFTTFRTAYQLDFQKRAGGTRNTDGIAQIQAVFLLGDHPSHDF